MNIEILLGLMVLVYTTGVIFKKLNLPIILGELLAGLIFGPAVLGVLHDDQTIKILAELGVFFLLLHAGMETEPQDLLHASKSGLILAISTFLIPLFAAAYVSMLFGFAQSEAIFIGLVISITSITVAIKMFKSFKMGKSEIAHTVMAAAIIQEIMAFTVLSVILSLNEHGAFSWVVLGIVIIKTLLFFFVTILIGQKILPFAKNIFNTRGSKGFTFTLIVALFFGFIAEKIGLHFVLGAFLAGIFVKEEINNRALYEKIEDRVFALSYSFLGPIFFVSLGFNMSFDVLKNDPAMQAFLITIIAVSIGGKIIPGAFSAYLTGKKKGKRSALVTGLCMNGRGAVDLIIASIGFEAAIISKGVFSVLVIAAFVATLVTPIALKLVLKKEKAIA